MITNSDLKKAAENFYIKKDELYNEIISSDSKVKKPRIFPLRRAVAAVAAAVILIVGCVSSYAVSPEVRNYINLWFMGDSQQKDKVPEGYIGIYTIKDLDNIRNDLGAKYILMKDLTFSDSDFAEGGAYAGGWTAIGNDENPFTGEFDGNGHVISNITLKQGETYTGLFGSSGSKKIDDKQYSYYKATYDGIIKNLGLNGVKADIKISKRDYYYVGSVIAYGGYVTGCYAENVSFNISFPDYKSSEEAYDVLEEFIDPNDGSIQQSIVYYTFDIGGICGRAGLIDSCYADIDIKLKDENNNLNQADLDYFLEVGSIAGRAYNIVTSYYTGSVTLNGNAFGSGEVLSYNTILPCLISEKRMEEIRQKLTEASPRNSKNAKLFWSFYIFRPIYSNRDLLMKNENASVKYYFLDPLINKKEIVRLENLLLQVYDKEEFKKGTLADGVKSGIDFCYTLEKGKTYDQSYFENFDFEKIWVMKDGVPKLRIFK